MTTPSQNRKPNHNFKHKFMHFSVNMLHYVCKSVVSDI